MKYRIFWNNHYPDFWRWHKEFCEKYNISRDVTINYVTTVELTDEQISLFQKAIKSGFIEHINKI
jgi:hypothetical protein